MVHTQMGLGSNFNQSNYSICFPGRAQPGTKSDPGKNLVKKESFLQVNFLFKNRRNVMNEFEMVGLRFDLTCAFVPL